MINKKIILQKFFLIVVAVLTLLSFSCGGGGSSKKDKDGDNYTLKSDVYSFGPNTSGKNVSFGACTFTGSISGDSPISSLATVTFDSSTGAISVTNGNGARGYEFTFNFSDTSFSNISFTDGEFIKSPASGSGTVATMSWEGSATPQMVAATLSDSEGNNISVTIQ